MTDDSSTVITASLPGRLMEKYMAGEGLSWHKWWCVVQIRQEASPCNTSVHKAWMEVEYPKIVLQRSTIAKAMAYCLPRWDKLYIYTRDARLNIENNPIQNTIRPVAVDRKNDLFAGNVIDKVCPNRLAKTRTLDTSLALIYACAFVN